MSINRQAVQLLSAAALQTALVIGHFAYGAHIYDDPGRLHVVAPALFFLGLTAALVGLHAWRPGAATRWLLVAESGAVHVGLFGAYHGGFGHAAKDLLYLHGVDAARLAEIFDSPDFIVPDDVIFELSGLATLAAAAVVAVLLVRLVRARAA